MAQAKRDQNNVPAMLFVGSDNTTTYNVKGDEVTGRVYVDLPGGSGTVTSVSVVSANGLAGTVATATSTPAITLSTTITGILKGNGTAISAVTIGSGLTFDGTTLSATGGGTGDVVGPASATDNAIARFDSTTGKLIQNSAVTVADSTGVIAGTQGVTFSGATSGTTALVPTAVAGTTTLTLPALTDTIAVLGAAQTFTGANTFSGLNALLVSSSGLTVRNPANTFKYTITAAAIAADRVLNLPLITGTDTLACLGLSQTFTGTQTFGTLVATTVNGNTFTTGTYTLTGTAGKTLTFQNSITLSGTDATTMTFPTTSKTLAANDGSNWTFASQAIGDLVYASSTTAFTRLAAVATGQVLVSAGTGTAPAWSSAPLITTIDIGNADTTLARAAAGDVTIEGVSILTTSNTKTVTNKRITKRVLSTSGPGATPTLNTDNYDAAHFTALATAITSMTTNLSGTPVEGDMLRIDFTDNGTARAITWGTSFEASGNVALPTTTVVNVRLDVGFVWNSVTSKWRCIAVA